MANKQVVSFRLNGKPVDVLVEPRELLIHTCARSSNQPARTSAARLALRRLHGRPRWHVGQVVHRAHGAMPRAPRW